MDAYDDDNVYYTNGSFTPKATACARFAEGEEARRDLVRKFAEMGKNRLKGLLIRNSLILKEAR
jgi:hypothetical protein